MTCRIALVVGGVVAIATACGRQSKLSPPADGDRAPVPWLWGRLQRGQWNVGIEVARFADSARAEPLADGARGPRPLDLVVWYPAARTDLTRDAVRFSAYVDLSTDAAPEARGGENDEARRRWLAASISRDPTSVPPPLLDSILRSRMAAVRNVPPVAARHPAILWSTRHATPVAQSVLSEYLASHGYVVAWMRYRGADSLHPPFADVPAPRKVETLEAHVADMQAALRVLAPHSAVDSTRMGVAAWSYSGEPATVLAQRTPALRVLVGLSSNILVSTYRGIDIAASFDSLPLRANVLMLEETGAARGQPREAPVVLDRLPGKVIRVSFPALAHGNFNVLEGMIPGLTGVTSVQPWSSGGAVAQSGYEAVAQAVLGLLQKTLRGAPEYGGFRAGDGVEVVLHGPGRGVSTTEGTAYRDTVVSIASNGWRLAASFTHPAVEATRVPAVLMLNKANGNRQAYAYLARELARRGVASLRLDLRGEGESTTLGSFVPGLPNAALDHPERDVAAAFAWLHAQRSVDSTRIAVVGASYSGEVMAVAQRAGTTARAYVALSPGSLSARTIGEIDARGVPWWILRSRNERFVRDVVDAARARSRSARVTEVEGTAHATDMLISNPGLNAEIAVWVQSALRR